MISAQDGKWRVSVDGQLDYPFDKESEALTFAKEMGAFGYDCVVYHSPLPTDGG